MPFGVNLMRSQEIYRAAQVHACVTLVWPSVCEVTDKMADEQVSLAVSDAVVMSVCLLGCPSGY